MCESVHVANCLFLDLVTKAQSIKYEKTYSSMDHNETFSAHTQVYFWEQNDELKNNQVVVL